MYFNEDEMVLLRIAELGGLVDRFILVEASSTFTGLEKPFFSDRIRNYIRDQEILDKIAVVRVTFPIGMQGPWEREAFQRNAILRGLPEDYQMDDVLIVSDADEIPRFEAVQRGAEFLSKYPYVPFGFKQELYTYRPVWLYHKPWHGSRATTVGQIISGKHSPQSLRWTTGYLPQEASADNGGWSFSYFGGVERIQEKVISYSHTEVNRPEFINREHILKSIKNGTSLVQGDGNVYTYREIGPHLPPFMLDNLEIYDCMMQERNEPEP